MMPLVGGRYMDPDEYADALQEAREDEYWEGVEEHGWTCAECGEPWNPGHVPATREEPADVRQDYCPRCGGDPITDERGFAVEGRQE